jgi:hypothetical protein
MYFAAGEVWLHQAAGRRRIQAKDRLVREECEFKIIAGALAPAIILNSQL